MSVYTEFFLNAKSKIVQLELFEISHSAFTQTYRKVRNNTFGVTAQLETGAMATFDYYPMRIEKIGIRENLDFGLKIDLGDLGEILPKELDRVYEQDKFSEIPKVTYRTYRSDDLNNILYGPLLLEVTSFNFKKAGASFEAKAPSLNNNATGEIYTYERFPALRGFL